jgi:hypothetical protein
MTQKSYGQQKLDKQGSEVSANVNFDELFQQVNHENKLKQVLLNNNVSQLLMKSNDKKGLDFFLKNNKSVCGITIINNQELELKNYNQLELNVSYSSYQVRVILSEVKGLTVVKKEEYWISMRNTQLN